MKKFMLYLGWFHPRTGWFYRLTLSVTARTPIEARRKAYREHANNSIPVDAFRHAHTEEF